MERLTQRDLTALLDVLTECNELRDLAAFPVHALRVVATLVAADRRSYNEVDVRKRRASFLTDPVLDLHDSQSIFNQHIAEHPLIAYYKATRNGQPVKFSDFLTRTQLHRLGLYCEFFRPLGVEHQMAFTLPTAMPGIVGIALGRGRRDFSERDRMLLDIVRPHLAQAYSNAGRLSSLKQDLALANDGIETLDAGLVWMQPNGRVSFISRAARRRLDAYFGLRRGPHLPDTLRRWVGEQERHLRAAATPRAPLVIAREGKRLIVRLIGHSARTLLLLEERRTSLDVQALDRLGLTRREAEILTWVAQGKTDAEIAMILGMSPRTVAKHLEHVFPKLGVETRTAAAVRAIEAAREES